MKKILLTSLVLGLCMGVSLAQSRTITGKITDAETGVPLVGVAIMVIGDPVTVTDIDGNYQIGITEYTEILVISYGCAYKEVKIGTSDTINISLKKCIPYNDTIKTALGREKLERSLSYAHQRISGEDLRKSNQPFVLDALRARVAGLNTLRSAGTVGAGSSVFLRGPASLTGNNQPLIIVDGIRMNNSTIYTESTTSGTAQSNRLMDLSTYDIEYVDILKGAAATALYGINGANGAIVITTKTDFPENRKIKVDFSTRFRTENLGQMPTLQNQFAQGSGDIYFGPESGSSRSWGPNLSTLRYSPDPDYLFDPRGRIVNADAFDAGSMLVEPFDPIEPFFQTGRAWDNALAIAFGDADKNLRFSFNDFRSEGVIPNNTYNRTSLRLGANLKATEKLKLSVNVGYTNSDHQRIQQGSNTSGLMLGLLRTPPSFDNTGNVDDPVNDPTSYTLPDGNQRNYRGGGGYDNPYWAVNNSLRTESVNRIFAAATIQYEWKPWLNAALNIGTDIFQDERLQRFTVGSRVAPGGRIIQDDYDYNHLDAYLNLFGTFSLNKALQLSYTVGANIYNESIDQTVLQGDAFSPAVELNINNASQLLMEDNTNRQKLASFYGAIDLAFERTFYLSLSARQDYSSTLIIPDAFEAGDIATIYPSLGMSLVFTELIGPSYFLDFGRLRLNYSIVGGNPEPFLTNAVFNPFSSIRSFIGTAEVEDAFELSDLAPNTSLQPESLSSLEAGFDLRLFRGKLRFDLSYYNRQADELLVLVPLVNTTGFSTAFLNAGSMSSNGLELMLSINPVSSRNFDWHIGLNFDQNTTTIDAVGEGNEFLRLTNPTFLYTHIPGYEYGQFLGGAYLRTGAGSFEDEGFDIPEGLIIVEDNQFSPEMGFPLIDIQERVIGNPNPDFLMGISNTFRYKNFSLSMLFDWKKGGDVWNGTNWALSFFGRTAETGITRQESAFVFPGVKNSNNTPNDISIVRDETYWASSVGGFGVVDEPFVRDGSWFRLRNIQLSYQLPAKWLNGTKFIRSCSLHFSGRNLIISTPYDGIDPEFSLYGIGNIQGIDYFNMPGTKSYSFGLDLNF